MRIWGYDSQMSDISVSPALKRTRELFNTGSFKRARRHCIVALAEDPENPRIITVLARIDAETGHVTFGEALTTVTGLMLQHPDDARLELAANALRYRPVIKDPGVLARSTEVIRSVYARHPDDSYVQQALAGQLGCDKSSHPEAWDLYKRAMDDGPLITPCYKGAAHHFAKIYEPELASRTLLGAGNLERWSILTRALKPKVMFTILFVLAFGAVMVRSTGNFSISVPLMLLATLWGGWCVYANSQLCCKKCRNAWIVTVLWVWIFFPAAKGIDWFVWLGLLVVVLIATWRTRKSAPSLTPQESGVQQ